jgi:2-(1,2-epoxy-1,2-dihydrophenyl)acetyl-CoA isomerase
MGKLSRAPTYSLGTTKRLIRSSFGTSLEDSLDREREAQRFCGVSRDYGEGVSAFKEKREPRFDGKGPCDIDSPDAFRRF